LTRHGRAQRVVDARERAYVPAIHDFLIFLTCSKKEDVDARDASAFTRVFDALCAGMTLRGFDQYKSWSHDSNKKENPARRRGLRGDERRTALRPVTVTQSQ
jgi:type II secretory pathway component PulK